MHNEDLINDWNRDEEAETAAPPVLMLDDETLRDGLQSPSVIDPPIEAKKQILHLMDALGIDTANIGLPGAGPRAVADVRELCREIAASRLSIRANCAARTMACDIKPIIDISQETGVDIETCMFIGSSPIRLYAENWDEDFLLRQTAEAMNFAIKAGMTVMYVTEDTSRAHPDTATQAVQRGGPPGRPKRVCVTDTVGHATPDGGDLTADPLRPGRCVDEVGGAEVGIDWHGHRDRGLGACQLSGRVHAPARPGFTGAALESANAAATPRSTCFWST